VGLCKATYAITAEATIHRAVSRAFASLAKAVSACGYAVLGAVFLGFTQAAVVIPADGTILDTVDGVFAPVADPVAARSQTVLGADQRSFTGFAFPVSATRRTVDSTGFEGFAKTAELVATATAVQQAGEETLAALALAVAAGSEAILGAGTAVWPVFVHTADAVATGTAIHRAQLGRVGVNALAVAADIQAIRGVFPGQADSVSAIVVVRARVAIFTRCIVFKLRVLAVPENADVFSARVVVVAILR
jgi:hypothetical protein